jgi:hypothetical protein
MYFKSAGCSLSYSSCKATLISGRIEGGPRLLLNALFWNSPYILDRIKAGEDEGHWCNDIPGVAFIQLAISLSHEPVGA